jgi:hypothetical protein
VGFLMGGTGAEVLILILSFPFVCVVTSGLIHDPIVRAIKMASKILAFITFRLVFLGSRYQVKEEVVYQILSYYFLTVDSITLCFRLVRLPGLFFQYQFLHGPVVFVTGRDHLVSRLQSLEYFIVIRVLSA